MSGSSLSSSTLHLCKLLATTGLCSRRVAEKVIMEGKVMVNGIKTTSVLANVSLDDKITIGNLKVKENSNFIVPKLWVAHKLPKETLVNKSENPNDNTIYKRYPHLPPTLTAINSLDYGAEGLCLLTDDPNFAYYINRPQNTKSIEKEVRIRMHGLLSESKIKGLAYGLEVNKIKYKPMKISIESTTSNTRSNAKSEDSKSDKSSTSSNTWINIVTADTHPRGMKNVLEKMFIKVTRLICTRVGNYKLGNTSTINKKSISRSNNSNNNNIPLLPGEILGPIDILHNAYVSSENKPSKSKEGKEFPLDDLQYGLLNYLYIQQKKLEFQHAHSPIKENQHATTTNTATQTSNTPYIKENSMESFDYKTKVRF